MYAIAVSSDGSKACTVADDGYVWLSSGGGMTWAKDSSLGIDEWRSVTMSPDGSKLLVCAKTGRVVLSHDAGSTWSELNGGQSQYTDCSMSADAQTNCTCSSFCRAADQYRWWLHVQLHL